jgi:hypothetical protein
MGQPTPSRAFRRLAICALVAVLAIGTTIPQTVAVASPPEERSDATSDSSTTVQDRHGPSGIWWSAKHEPDTTPSYFQNWWTSAYINLLSLQSAIKLAFAYAWNLGHTKPDNTCS